MFVKVFFIALIASAVSQSESRYASYESNSGGPIHDTKVAIEKLIEKVQNAIDEGVTQVILLGQDLATYSDKTMRQYVLKVQEESRKLGEQLAQIKEDAKGAGVDISDCLQGRDDEFKEEFPRIYAINITRCGGEKVFEGRDIIGNATKHVQDTIDEVNKLTPELDECGGGVEDLTCVTRVMDKIRAQSINVPVEIGTETTKASKLVATLKLSLEDCAKENVLQMVVDGQKIIEDITECVNNKNNSTNVAFSTNNRPTL